ncbi:MAG: hypothetical protein DWQ06_08675 [Calditrichaeota bacterium]|nr:MAG: hypothetical protein DWQ06_08675 [Calditrichota bacterium]
MFIPRHETEVLQKKLTQAIENGIGSTILISGEPGIGKTTLIKNFMDNCDSTSEKNVLTAVGSCLDMDGVSRGFLPWREVLIELDADKAAGKDEEKKSNFKKIVKTVFDEAGSQWLEAIPVIGDISSAIFETAKSAKKDELIDVETGDTKKLALKDRLKNVAKECTGEWLNVIPVVGNLSAAIYKTTTAIQKSKQVTYSQNQQDFFIRVMSRFRELCENNPVVIYIDDLQWADISSMNLFFYLAKNLKDSPYPLVLIGSFRPQDVKDGRLNPISGEMERHPWEEKMNNLDRYEASELIEVSYLDQNQVGSFIDLQFPKNEFGVKFKDEIVNLTRGNSLFVRELLLNLEERKIISEKYGTYFSDETLDLSTLPKTVSGVIKERFQRLSEELQEILQVASAQGSDFSLELISSILEENSFKVSKKINTLQQKYSLVLKSETVYDKLKKIYNFTHNLVQKYIYYQMSEDFRLDLHSALVETLEEFFEGDEIFKIAEPYSYHFGVANGIIDENRKLLLDKNQVSDEILDEYLKFQKTLAEDFHKNYQFEEATNKYLELTNIYKIRNYKEAEIEAMLELCKVYTYLGEFDKTISQLELCLIEAEKEDFQKLIGIICLRLGEALSIKGKYEKAEELFEKALKIFEISVDKHQVATLISVKGSNSIRRNNYEEAMKNFRESLKTFEEVGDQKRVAKISGNIGVIYFNKGEFDKALKYFERWLKINNELGDKGNSARALTNIANVHRTKGDNDKALQFAQESLEMGEDIGDKINIGHIVRLIGTIYTERGELDRGLQFYQRGLKIFENLCLNREIANTKFYIGDIYGRKEIFDTELKYYSDALKVMEEVGAKRIMSHLYANMGLSYLKTENHTKSLEVFEKGLEIANELKLIDMITVHLSYKTKVLITLEKFEEAKIVNIEAIEATKKLNRKDETFKIRLQSSVIDFALGDKENPPKELLEMLSQTEVKEEIANLNYELWKMTSEENYKIEALKLYQELYSKIPNFKYKKCIEELSKT